MFTKPAPGTLAPFLARTAVYFAASALLVLFAVSYLQYQKVEHENTRVKEREMLRLSLAGRVAINEIQEVSGDLRTLAGRAVIEDYLGSPNARNRARVERQFRIFAENYKRYDQVRLLDIAGRERIRVNYNAGIATTVAPEDLQDKSERYYVSAARKLKPGEIYISPLDLNIEGDAVELPIKPTIRVAMLLFDDAAARARAILIVNVLAAEMLSRFRDVIDGAPGEAMILNGAGYWLSAVDSADEWGFVLGHGASFAKRYPAAWQRIANAEAGTVEAPGGTFVFRTLHPHQPEFLTRTDEVWKTVIRLPAVTPNAALIALKADTGLLATILSFIAVLSALLAWFRTAEIEKRRAHAESERRLAEAEAIAHVGHWEWDIRNDAIAWSDEIYHIFGRAPQAFVSTHAKFLDTLHPDDRERVADAVAAAVRGDAPYVIEHRIVLPDGRVRVVSENGKVERDDAGAPLRMLGIVRDITERKRAEEALQQTSERIRDLYNNAPCGYHSIDARGMVIEMNDTELRWLGYSRDEVVGKRHATDLLTTQGRKTFEQSFRTFQERGWVSDVEYDFVRKDGSTFPVLVNGTAVTGPDGKLLMSRSTVFDNTARKRAEAALYQREQEFRALAERSPDMIGRLDRNLRSLYISPAIERATGFPPAYFAGKDIRTLELPAESLSSWIEHVQAVFDTAEECAFEFSHVAPDGKKHFFSTYLVPEFDAEGRVETVMTVSRDITPLHEAEARVRLLLDSVAEGVYGMDRDGNCTFINPEGLRLLGYTEANELLGKDIHALIHHTCPDGSALPAQSCRIQRAFREGRAFHVDDEVFWRRDGTNFASEYRSRPLIKDGKIAGAVATFMDITTRRAMELALHESETKLRAQAQELADGAVRKDQFIATLAHELRNPLAPIRNAFEIVKRASDNAVVRGAVAIGERQVAQLVRLVEDLLDISRITRGKITLHRERISLQNIVETVLETSRPYVDAGGHTLTVDLPAEPMVLDADLTRIAQAISNLLINATKFTDRNGQIRLTARREKDELAIAVQDNGVGIEPAMLPFLFDLFMQAETAGSRERGLGIGLSLVRSLVELHGGRVEVASEGLGRGSTFTIYLPVAAASVAPEAPVLAQAQTATAPVQRRILVVDDDRDVAWSTAVLLQSYGHEVRTAASGASAIETALAQVPDVVLLDIGLPDMDGYDVARRLRAEPRLRNTRLIALTGRGQEVDRRRSSDAGILYHILKPVDPVMLEAIVREDVSGPVAERAVSLS